MNKETRCINCIVCPIGCELSVDLIDGQIDAIRGASCSRGQNYAREETTMPKRMLTSTVRIQDAILPLLPVVSEKPLPKELVASCAVMLRNITVQAPVRAGDVIVENICGSDINIVASRSMEQLTVH